MYSTNKVLVAVAVQGSRTHLTGAVILTLCTEKACTINSKILTSYLFWIESYLNMWTVQEIGDYACFHLDVVMIFDED